MSGPKTAKRILLLGDARQVHLTRWCQYFKDAGYRVLSVSLEPVDSMPGETARIQVPGFLPGFLRYPLALSRVRRLIDAFDPQLINAHFLPNYGLMAARTHFTPWVLSTWGSDIMVLPQKSAFHRWRTTYVLRRASFVTSDAASMTERLVRLGVDPHRILTVPFGVDPAVFHPSETGTQTGGPRILSNRKLESVYGIETVIDAFPRIRAFFDEATLTVAGDGSLRRTLVGQARRSQGARSVGDELPIRFPGAVAHEHMPDLLRRHDIFVSMALSDTTSVSLLEAMACGLFPIVSDIPANREWVEHGHNGFLVPTDDADRVAQAVIGAWSDKELRERARETNRSIIRERADWNENMAQVGALFDTLIESKST